MISICIDTNVWLALLKVDFYDQDNLFEEITYWIEKGFLLHIAPQNIVTEWNTNFVNDTERVISELKKNETETLKLLKNSRELQTTYETSNIEAIIKDRVQKVSNIFSSFTKIAHHNDQILMEAGSRNLRKLAPNHSKDSFRDTVNILTLITFLKDQVIDQCIFTTLNYKDFSASNSKRFELHTQLDSDFQSCNLQYYYFGENDNGKINFGTNLIAELRKRIPNNYQDYLKKKREREMASVLQSKKDDALALENRDVDYLENIKLIDVVMLSKSPTSFQQKVLDELINSHESYKKYFFQNVGNNGLV